MTNKKEVGGEVSTISSSKMTEINGKHVYKNYICKVKKNKSQQSCDKCVFHNKAPKFIGQKMPCLTRTARTYLGPSAIQRAQTS